MARSRIRKDSYGLFIVADGNVFRPDYPMGYKHLENNAGSFKKGELVNANHRGGTPLVNIKRVGEKEAPASVWYSHGSAYVPNGQAIKRQDSEAVFRPSYESWGT